MNRLNCGCGSTWRPGVRWVMACMLSTWLLAGGWGRAAGAERATSVQDLIGGVLAGLGEQSGQWADLGDALQITPGADLSSYAPAVAVDGDRVYCAWAQQTSASASNWGIYLKVFDLEWDRAEAQWRTLGHSWAIPSAINGLTLALQGGVAAATQAGGDPLVTWNTAPLDEELATALAAVTTSDQITAELVQDIQAALSSATYEIAARRFGPLPDLTAEVSSVAIRRVHRFGPDDVDGNFGVDVDVTAAANRVVKVERPNGTVLVVPYDRPSGDQARYQYYTAEYQSMPALEAAWPQGAYVVRVYDSTGTTVLARVDVTFGDGHRAPLPFPNAVPRLVTPADPEGDLVVTVPAATDTQFQWLGYSAAGGTPGTATVMHFGLNSYALGIALNPPGGSTDLDGATSYTHAPHLPAGMYSVLISYDYELSRTDSATGALVSVNNRVITQYDMPVETVEVTSAAIRRTHGFGPADVDGNFGVEVDVTATANQVVEVERPNGTVVVVPCEGPSGDQARYHYYTSEYESLSALDTAWPQGAYVVRVYYPTGSTVLARVDLAFNDGSRAPLPFPDAVPRLVTPADPEADLVVTVPTGTYTLFQWPGYSAAGGTPGTASCVQFMLTDLTLHVNLVGEWTEDVEGYTGYTYTPRLPVGTYAVMLLYDYVRAWDDPATGALVSVLNRVITEYTLVVEPPPLNVAAHVYRLGLFLGTGEGRPSDPNDTHYVAEFSAVTDLTVVEIDLQPPGAPAPVAWLFALSDGWDDEEGEDPAVSWSYEILPDGSTARWTYRLTFPAGGEADWAAAFPPGVYAATVRLYNGSSGVTNLTFSQYDVDGAPTGVDIAPVAATPAFLVPPSPADGAVIAAAGPVTWQWAAPVGPEVDHVRLTVLPAGVGGIVAPVFEGLYATQAGGEAVTMATGLWATRLGTINSYGLDGEIANADGVVVRVGRFATSTHQVTVGPAYTVSGCVLNAADQLGPIFVAVLAGDALFAMVQAAPDGTYAISGIPRGTGYEVHAVVDLNGDGGPTDETDAFTAYAYNPITVNGNVPGIDLLFPPCETLAVSWATGVQGWRYYGTAGGGPDPAEQPVSYVAGADAGGDGGYVRTPLAEVCHWHAEPAPVCFLGAPETTIQTMDFADATVAVALQLPSGSVLGENASVRFFVGRPATTRGADPDVFVTHECFEIGDGQWQTSALDLSSDPGEWMRYGDGTYELAAALDQPVYWGLAVVGSDGTMDGYLAVDSLHVMAPVGFTLPLEPGWNLISFPVIPEQTVGEIFAGARSTTTKLGSLWGYDSALRRYLPVHDGDHPAAQKGYWVYSLTGGVTRPISGAPAAGTVDLLAGWNLVGPAKVCPLPVHADLASDVWWWLALAQRYEGEQAPGTTPMVPGFGYWLLALADVQGLPLDTDIEDDDEDVWWSCSAEDWDSEEMDLAQLYMAAQGASNDVAADDEIFSLLDVRGDTTALRSDPDRTISYNPAQQRVEVNYHGAKAQGDVYVSREGTIGNRYYLVDFQDNFTFLGIDIDGQVELRRRGDPGAFDVSIRNDQSRRLTLGATDSNRHLKAVLLLAAVIVVRSDTVEVSIPRDNQNSRLTGDPSWGSTVAHLGSRSFPMFTTETSTPAWLVFPRNDPECGCPRSGLLQLAAAFEHVAMQLRDGSDGIANNLSRNGFDSAIADAFRTFAFDFARPLQAVIAYRFQSGADPVLGIPSCQAVKVPINPGAGEVPMDGGTGIMTRVDQILTGLGLTSTVRNLARNRVSSFLQGQADSSGCIPLDQERVKGALINHIQRRFDLNSLCSCR